MCITLEIHNTMHLHTIPFCHVTVSPLSGLPWVFSNISLCCANLCHILTLLLFSKVTGKWRFIFTFAKLVSVNLKHTTDRTLTTLEKREKKGRDFDFVCSFFCCYFSGNIVCITTTNYASAVFGVCGREAGVGCVFFFSSDWLSLRF